MITLKNINEATLQDIFDQASNHLLKQNKKAREEYSTTCRYRTNDGLMCAVGCLISDDEYSHSFEGKSLQQLDEVNWERDLALDNDVIDLLDAMQEIHDGCGTREWRRELKKLAFDNGLQFNYKTK